MQAASRCRPLRYAIYSTAVAHQSSLMLLKSCTLRGCCHQNLLTCRTTVFSHSQTVVVCSSCSSVLCTPSGGRARLTEGMQADLHSFSAISGCFTETILICNTAIKPMNGSYNSLGGTGSDAFIYQIYRQILKTPPLLYGAIWF